MEFPQPGRHWKTQSLWKLSVLLYHFLSNQYSEHLQLYHCKYENIRLVSHFLYCYHIIIKKLSLLDGLGILLEIILTHWDRVTHLVVNKLTIIGSDIGLSPDRRQAIIWTNDGKLLIGPLTTNFSEILIEIITFSFKKMRLRVSSAKRRPFCLGLNVLMVFSRGAILPSSLSP